VRPLAEDLFAAGYTVSGPLLPGHGSQPAEANHYVWQDWAAALEAVLDRLNKHCAKVVIGGESLGGVLALYLASKHPETSGLLLYAPALKLYTPLISLLARVLAPFLAAKKKPVSIPSPADPLWQGYTVYPLKAMLQLFELQKVVSKRLSLVHQPILILQGAKDRSVHPDVPERIQNSVSSNQVEIHRIVNSGHCVLLECEHQQTTSLTLDFLRKIGLDPNQL
jgi:carboxylesterase